MLTRSKKYLDGSGLSLPRPAKKESPGFLRSIIRFRYYYEEAAGNVVLKISIGLLQAGSPTLPVGIEGIIV